MLACACGGILEVWLLSLIVPAVLGVIGLDHWRCKKKCCNPVDKPEE